MSEAPATALDGFACRICGETSGRSHLAREMMIGLRDAFAYFECASCGCVQIVEPPADLARYYGEGYYSFGGDLDAEFADSARRETYRRTVTAYLTRPSCLARRIAHADMKRPLWSLRRLRLKPASRVLDVGCGSGRLLYQLKLAGFDRLLGIDAFLPETRTYANGLEIRRARLDEVEGNWDAIMLHHAFEHVPEPKLTLAEIAERLAPGGRALLRLPLADSEAWRRYGVDWVQLDAPRHLFLHTRRSLEIAAAAAGLKIEAVRWDSYELQFWGSEQYRRDIPLQSEQSYRWGQGAPLFTPEEIAGWRAESEQLNRAGTGDQAAVYLRRR